MRNPLPYGIKPLSGPGTRVIQNPHLVHVQFERRRARQFIKLIDQGSALNARYSGAQGLSGSLQWGRSQISQGSFS